MCGRYALRTSVPEIARILGLEDLLELQPRYNIAPTQPVPVCRLDGDGARELVLVRWGLVPHWAKDARSGYRMINARAETVATKPAFRAALRHRRCLVPADGYFEWQRTGQAKQPYFFHLDSGRPFCFAGLWASWGQGEDRLESCTIITTEANELGAAVHPRMPVILDPTRYALWLDTGVDDPSEVTGLLRPFPAARMALHPVSTLVNSPRNDRPECVQPIAL